MRIRLREIGFSYPGGDRVFESLGLEVKEGERVALTGPIGSGKTTLMKIIMGLLRPGSGEVELFGKPRLSEDDFADARRRMGFVFQDPEDQLFSPTVEEDIAFGPLNLGRTHMEAREDVAWACGLFGISHLRTHVTHRLSGGQKRLVALATAAAMRPEVMILDEPTSGLDQRGTETLVRYLLGYSGTCLIASHDKAFLEAVTSRSVEMGGA
jgi:cobalt/nickel transport system ATP-binding protein